MKKTLVETAKHELNRVKEPLQYLIVINEMWWQRHYTNKNVVDLTILPKTINEKLKREARELFVFLDFDTIEGEEMWMAIMAELTEFYRAKEPVIEEEPDWKPLDL